jgi:outer membrane protein OmpA-like peptidoglycan-associated protein
MTVAVAVVSFTALDGAGAAARQDRDFEPRVRDLTYRSRALDNSERVEETGEDATVTFAADVLFEFDQASLAPSAAPRLDRVADELSDLGPRTVTISGHSDSMGDPAYNQDLSERRAVAVRAALAERLGADFSFEVTGHGETQPVAANENDDGSDNPEGRALNRRVEIEFPTD